MFLVCATPCEAYAGFQHRRQGQLHTQSATPIPSDSASRELRSFRRIRAVALEYVKTDPLMDPLREGAAFPGDRAGALVSELTASAATRGLHPLLLSGLSTRSGLYELSVAAPEN